METTKLIFHIQSRAPDNKHIWHISSSGLAPCGGKNKIHAEKAQIII